MRKTRLGHVTPVQQSAGVPFLVWALKVGPSPLKNPSNHQDQLNTSKTNKNHLKIYAGTSALATPFPRLCPSGTWAFFFCSFCTLSIILIFIVFSFLCLHRAVRKWRKKSTLSSTSSREACSDARATVRVVKTSRDAMYVAEVAVFTTILTLSPTFSRSSSQ